ncbi:glycosyltransferase [Limnobaculum parvum]|uniref:Glycosyltransferase n=2 Tax=Limnobaculum parvum TaxID=2172103 RepID=A0A2Y9U259_9GAMM|nr:glycosyltransferase [Limnobaculum parvum]
MPAYNAADTIHESIMSVLEQTFTDFRLYVVNDCSTDKTKDVIMSFSDKRIVYIENNINLGVSESRNLGIKESRGKYIAFLDSDDLWKSEKLEIQYNLLLEGWDIVCSNYQTFSGSPDNILNLRISPEVISYKEMLKSNFIGNLTGIYNSDKLSKIYQNKVGHEDYVMWLELVKKAQKIYCVQESLALYRVTDKSLSSNKVRAMFWQLKIYRNVLGFSLIKSGYYFFFYILYAIHKRK